MQVEPGETDNRAAALDDEVLWVTCPHCRQRRKTKRAFIGMSGKCKCGHRFVIAESNLTACWKCGELLPEGASMCALCGARPRALGAAQPQVARMDFRIDRPVGPASQLAKYYIRLFVASAVIVVLIAVWPRASRTPPPSVNHTAGIPPESVDSADDKALEAFREVLGKYQTAKQTRGPQDIDETKQSIERFRQAAIESTKLSPRQFNSIVDKIKAIYDECDKNRYLVSPSYIKELGEKYDLPMSEDQAQGLYDNYIAMEELK